MSASVLVVDDSELSRRAIRDALEGSHHELVEASDGCEGLVALQSNEQVRLVLCDVHMPNMGGLEFLKKAKESGNFDQVKFVMLTSSGSPNLVREARSSGASGWLVKPVKREMLRATVDKILSS